MIIGILKKTLRHVPVVPRGGEHETRGAPRGVLPRLLVGVRVGDAVAGTGVAVRVCVRVRARVCVCVLDHRHL